MKHTGTWICGALLAALGSLSLGCDGKGKSSRCSDDLAALDADGDTFVASDAELPRSCDGSLEDALASAGLSSGDCDDGAADIYPGAGEICDDGTDQDCDGTDPTVTTWYTDLDADGYGDGATGTDVCEPPEGTVSNGDDCDDADPAVNPGAVETICGDPKVVPDLNCDNFTDCAIAGNLDDAGWASLGISTTLEESAGRSMKAESFTGGRVLVGGDNGAYWLTYSAGTLSAEALTIEGSVSAGVSVALLDDADEDGAMEPIVGDKAFDSTSGRISVLYSGGEAGSMTGSASGQYVGVSLASGGGLIAATRYLEGDFRVYLAHPADLPPGGESYELSSSTMPGVNYVSAGSELTAADVPAVDVAPVSTSWAVAVGQPAEATLNNRVVVYLVTSSDVVGACVINDSSDTLGSSVLLMDIDGDGALDLLAGDPGAQSVYVFSNVLACGGDTLSTRDADYSAFGSVARLGSGMTSVPDMNGDGIADLLVGGANGAVLVLGFDAETSESSSLPAYATLSGSDGFGASVASTDLNSDGYADLLIGAPNSGQIVALWGGL